MHDPLVPLHLQSMNDALRDLVSDGDVGVYVIVDLGYQTLRICGLQFTMVNFRIILHYWWDI